MLAETNHDSLKRVQGREAETVYLQNNNAENLFVQNGYKPAKRE